MCTDGNKIVFAAKPGTNMFITIIAFEVILIKQTLKIILYLNNMGTF